MNKNQEEEIRDMLLRSSQEYYHNISVDVVIFGYHERTLKILLQKPTFADKWMLPGGYIKRSQTTHQAVCELIENRTRLKIKDPFYFNVYSKPGRNRGAAEQIAEHLKKIGFEAPNDFWMFDDFITLGYFALTEYTKVQPSGDYYAEECQWFNASELPEMMYDHNEIAMGAIGSIRYILNFHPVGYDLLPEKFTLPEIHSLYETILGRKIDERNFLKKMTKIGLIKRLNERRNIGAHRAPYLYIFDKGVYDRYYKDNNVSILAGF